MGRTIAISQCPKAPANMIEASKVRIGGSKVRTGCRTCKARRVKCDETKPECLRCVKLNRRCEGYSRSPEPESAIPVRKFVHYVSPSLVVPLSRNPSPRPELDSTTLRALTFFQHSTALQLEQPFSADLWTRGLSCYMQQEPAILYGVAALASLHENLLYPNKSVLLEKRRVLALEYYGRSIQHVVYANQKSTKSALMTTLISCLLFSAIESIQRHVVSAVRHINAGLGLLMEHETQLTAQEHSGMSMPIGFVRSIAQLFVSLGSQMFSMKEDFTDAAVIQYLLSPPGTEQYTLGSTGEALATLSQITNDAMCLYTWAESCHQDADFPSQPYCMAGEQLQSRFDNWMAGYSALSALGNENDESRDRQYLKYTAILVLRVNALACHILLAMKYEKGQSAYDKYLDHFKAIVSAAQEYMEILRNAPKVYGEHASTASYSPQDLESPAFSLTSGITPMLFFTCRNCRDSVTRHRALALLKLCRRREFIWDSEAVSVVAERLIQMEEEDAKRRQDMNRSRTPLAKGETSQQSAMNTDSTAEIPEFARINALCIGFSTDEDAAQISVLNQSGEHKFLQHVSWKEGG